jgi:predicted DNA-binding protein (UPF0251 family)
MLVGRRAPRADPWARAKLIYCRWCRTCGPTPGGWWPGRTISPMISSRTRSCWGTNLKAWLFQILHNRFCSVVSRKHVRAETSVDDLSWLASVPAFQESRPEVREFKLAFARLTPAHREVLVLHAVQGLSYEEIAAICGCEIGTVKSRINRARNVLKQMLLGEGGPSRSLHAPPLQARAQRKPTSALV